MNIGVAGLWHLGSVTAACLAAAGHRVVGFDADEKTVAGLVAGHPPLFEPGLEELVRSGLASGRLGFSSRPDALAGCDVVWITWDTPVDEEDRADVEFVRRQVEALFPVLRPDALMLISSQLPVGSTRRLEERFRAARPEAAVTFACSPENLRLGKAIEAFTRPERVVVGVRSAADRERLERLFAPLRVKIEWMSVESAEMTKHAMNAFLAVSVTFTNELASLCERLGADAREVERGLRSDPRVGPRAYVRAGGAFAGGTLARDIRFLASLAEAQGLAVPVLAAVRPSNEAHQEWPRRRLREILGDLGGRTVAVLGLTYKPGTDTLRRSSSVETCLRLAAQGAHVAAYDPAVRNLPEELARVFGLRASAEEAIRGAEAVLVATPWPAFREIAADTLVAGMKQAVVLDPDGFLEQSWGRDPRVRYFTVGRAG